MAIQDFEVVVWLDLLRRIHDLLVEIDRNTRPRSN